MPLADQLDLLGTFFALRVGAEMRFSQRSQPSEAGPELMEERFIDVTGRDDRKSPLDSPLVVFSSAQEVKTQWPEGVVHVQNNRSFEAAPARPAAQGIARSCCISQSTVHRYLERAEAEG